MKAGLRSPEKSLKTPNYLCYNNVPDILKLQQHQKHFQFRFWYFFPVHRLLKKVQFYLWDIKFRFLLAHKSCENLLLHCQFHCVKGPALFFQLPEHSQREILDVVYSLRLVLKHRQFHKSVELRQFHCSRP